MILNRIIIKNFKSIKEIDFEIQKYGNSYTNFLLGVNEVGKSNILEAMSLMNNNSEKFDFSILHNQKEENEQYINIYFYLEFENKNTYLDIFKNNLENGNLLDFEITNICKNNYLEKEDTTFTTVYTYDVKIKNKVYINIDTSDGIILRKDDDGSDNFVLLESNNFDHFFYYKIIDILIEREPKVSYWKPSEEYLISSNIDLNSFKNNINSNVPLKNIFALGNYKTQEVIAYKIEEILSNPSKRSRLQSELSSATTNYIKNIWKHSISFIIEISETGNLIIAVKDDGENNEHDRHFMNVRSEGFKQFISLILSLSVETKELNQDKNLILIDEPENHLHPSGIRDLSRELLSIGEKNYLFVSTHSPYMIDDKHKERHTIIKKDSYANTIKKEIKDEIDLRDDEVLSQAFGISVYKDLLNPKRLLVEGASDKLILSKLFNAEKESCGITNGKGTNIVNIASLFNDDNISILVLVDADEEGKKYKKQILNIKGVYSSNNVFTLEELALNIKSNGTIEDCLGIEFIQSKFDEKFKDVFQKDSELLLNDDSPFLYQIKIYLQQKKIQKNEIDKFLNNLKIYISENIQIGNNYKTKFPLLEELFSEIKKKI